jgi:hypothetical protein
VDDPVYVRGVYPVARHRENLEPLLKCQQCTITARHQGIPDQQWHGEPRPAIITHSGIEDGGDAIMLDAREHPLLKCEAPKDVSRGNAWLEDLDRNLASYRAVLARCMDHAESTLTNYVQKGVGAATHSAGTEGCIDLRTE